MEKTVNIPVQMICCVSTQGNFTPIRFRFEDEEHNLTTVHISQILAHNTTTYNGIEEIHYTCKAPIADKETLFDLKYTIDSHKWLIFKLLPHSFLLSTERNLHKKRARLHKPNSTLRE